MQMRLATKTKATTTDGKRFFFAKITDSWCIESNVECPVGKFRSAKLFLILVVFKLI